MPELPEVETITRGLDARLKLARIAGVQVHRPDLRYPLPGNLRESLQGQHFLQFERIAKYITARLSNKLILIVHLGMSGRLILDNKGQTSRHEHVTIELNGGQRLHYVDPRRFGMIDLVVEGELKKHRWFRHLGAEPLEKGFSSAILEKAFANCSAPVKSALMDQKKITGVGNIYANEALHRACIWPLTRARDIPTPQLGLLADSIVSVLEFAIQAGGSSLNDYVQANGEIGNFQSQFKVYGRNGQPCMNCTANIEKIQLAGRATYYCPRCQKAS